MGKKYRKKSAARKAQRKGQTIVKLKTPYSHYELRKTKK